MNEPKKDAATRAVDHLVEQKLLDPFQRYNIAQVIRAEYEKDTLQATTFIIARSISNPSRYACKGESTGYGYVLDSTENPLHAERLYSAAGVMKWMGGHYRGFEAVELKVTSQLGAVLPFPDPKNIWPED